MSNTHRVLCWTQWEWGIHCSLGLDSQTPSPAVLGTAAALLVASDHKKMQSSDLYSQLTVNVVTVPHQRLTCMSLFVMKPFPSLSHSTNSSLALPMVSACGLPGTTSLGEASGLRPRPGLGLPADGIRGLGLTGTVSPLPWPTNTSPSFNHIDITVEKKHGWRCGSGLCIYKLVHQQNKQQLYW